MIGRCRRLAEPRWPRIGNGWLALFDLAKLVLTLATAIVLGLGATYLSIARRPGLDAIQAGPWTVWPRIGSNAIDPYERAAIARTGEVPLGLAEGLMFVATIDDRGAALVGKCIYRVAGPVPAGRFWTLTPTTLEGYLIDNPAKRYGFTSQEIVRRTDGSFQLVLSRAARPGNWQPLGDSGPFQLVLRVYDTTLSATAATLEKTLMPSISREGC